ncbi:MAG TPA: hypothetical protein VIH17_05245 [Candidatus Acidoferrales bacterium]
MKVKLFLGEGRDQAMLQFRDYFSRPLSSMGRSILSVAILQDPALAGHGQVSGEDLVALQNTVEAQSAAADWPGGYH